MSIRGEFDQDLTLTAFPDGAQHHYWLWARNWIIYDLLRRLGSRGTILDVGCGRGITVDFLRSRGLECFGCDIAGGPAISSRARPFLRFRTSSLDLEPALAQKVHVILLLDVLEHVSDPRDFLARHSVHFPNALHLVLTLPALPDIWSNYDEHYGHRARYTRETACDLLRGAPYVSVDTGYFFHLLYQPVKAMLALGFPREVRVASPRSYFHMALHGLLTAWFRAEARLFPGRVPGTSLFMLCRRVRLF